jgi:hypothetical protein
MIAEIITEGNIYSPTIFYRHPLTPSIAICQITTCHHPLTSDIAICQVITRQHPLPSNITICQLLIARHYILTYLYVRS